MLKQIRWRKEVRVEDEKEISGSRRHGLLECSGFEPRAIVTVTQQDIKPTLFETCGTFFTGSLGLVRGVVENLDLQLVLRIIKQAHGFEEPVDDEDLIVDGQLHGDLGEHLKTAGRGRGFPFVLPVKVKDAEPVRPEHG